MSIVNRGHTDGATGNQLHRENSPYLLQHKDNPVHWYAWGSPAFDAARRANKPILLSVGYAACHWCHVMAHESFEDATTAEIMNSEFINIKVDREERPDVDRIYMSALHALGEHGGWPLTMFLTPELEPFWGGTYFPPVSRYGRPSFRHVLTEIARIWRMEPEKISSNAGAITASLRRSSAVAPPVAVTLADLERHAGTVLGAVDPVHGGLKGAPKFPQAPLFDFLRIAGLRHDRADLVAAVELTLRNMAQGGIYDHLGGGLARYSVDGEWLVPHFEKMLYDNAQFVSQATRLWLQSRSPLLEARVNETIGFVLRAMTTPEGMFVSSFDADSEGVEGKYYVWSKREIEDLLNPLVARTFCESYAVTEEGNWEGQTILRRSADPSGYPSVEETALEACRSRLLAARSERVPPARDDKVLADWNGLMIAALADAGFVFQRSEWLAAAETAMQGILGHLFHGGRLRHSFCGGKADHAATADDYSNLIRASLALHAATGGKLHLQSAVRLADEMIEDHWDVKDGGLYFSSVRADGIITRIKTVYDDATPAANGTVMGAFARLHVLTGNGRYRQLADTLFSLFSGAASQNPFAAPSFLASCYDVIDPIQIAACGPGHEDFLRNAISLIGLDASISRLDDSSELPLHHPHHGKRAHSSTPAIYLCRGATCAMPATDAQGLKDAMAVLGLPAQGLAHG